MSDPARPGKFAGLSRLKSVNPDTVVPEPGITTPAVTPDPVVRRRKPPAAKPTEGKRGNPEFVQVSAYVREATHRAAKIALLQRGSDGDFSDLVEALLQAWVAGQVKV